MILILLKISKSILKIPSIFPFLKLFEILWYYSISISINNDQLNAKKLEGLNDYLIVKEEINF